MIRVEHITKSFKGNKVLDNFSMHVNKGDKVLIKGRNGSGKSTLLKIISGLIEADEGKVIFEESQNIGALIENPSFIEFRPLSFNLKYLYNLKSTLDEEKVKSLCERFYLNYDSKVPMKSYSVGMRQKAGIIQAFMEDQNIILLDEPTRGIDDESIKQFYELIKNNGDTTIIIAAHEGVDEIAFDKKITL